MINVTKCQFEGQMSGGHLSGLVRCTPGEIPDSYRERPDLQL